MSDNPSAFPVNAANLGGPGAYEPDPGMTLRDWFAGQALAGLFANVKMTEQARNNADMANVAYSAADAMLAQRATGAPQ